jgi:tripartite-type tricarboxylate transporter receptor subunit TctC
MRTLLLTLLLFAGNAFPQVKIVVPFPPGGGADSLARLMAPKLQELWHEQVIIENKPGASGHIGAEQVAHAMADGKTLLMSSTASLTESNVKQFAPITLVSASPYVVTASLKLPVASIAELIDYAKRNPGKVTFGSSGTGAASHLSAELFKRMAGVDMMHVPYKGTGQAVTDLLGGQIDLLFAPAQTVMPHVKGGKLKALATTGPRRPEELPDLPTVAQTVPGYSAVGWFGLLAPAATPKSVIQKISTDANRVLADKDVRAKMQALGAEPGGGSPEGFAAFIRDDMAKWSKLMKEAGIKPE